ncbi:inositol monophosphatase family protein [Streptococcus devriesei]|uniref:inositol monophosphatase family protein n=1 Tax=Streptococcus devriesei TaxID=231233 RepID=UPI00041898C7|nr:inositol monophosphatase family protein [Streptococcus devriesei]
METKFQFAKELIYEAGRYIRDNMTHDLVIEEKSRFDDLVTDLDKAVQELMVERIHSAYPEDHFFAEEEGLVSDIDDGCVWVLDPIDGTVNFIVQGCDFAVMIAYYENGIGQFGLIYDVMNDVLYSGGGQFEVRANDKPLPSFQDRPFKRSLIGANSAMCAQNIMGVADLGRQTLGIRGIGSAGLSICRILEGRFIAYFSNIAPWDYAAGSIMGEKLGYTILDLYGHKPDYKSRQMVMFIPKAKLKEIQKYIK